MESKKTMVTIALTTGLIVSSVASYKEDQVEEKVQLIFDLPFEH
ncbi:hypothetical protein [Bacillus cereus]